MKPWITTHPNVDMKLRLSDIFTVDTWNIHQRYGDDDNPNQLHDPIKWKSGNVESILKCDLESEIFFWNIFMKILKKINTLVGKKFINSVYRAFLLEQRGGGRGERIGTDDSYDLTAMRYYAQINNEGLHLRGTWAAVYFPRITVMFVLRPIETSCKYQLRLQHLLSLLTKKQGSSINITTIVAAWLGLIFRNMTGHSEKDAVTSKVLNVPALATLQSWQKARKHI